MHQGEDPQACWWQVKGLQHRQGGKGPAGLYRCAPCMGNNLAVKVRYVGQGDGSSVPVMGAKSGTRNRPQRLHVLGQTDQKLRDSIRRSSPFFISVPSLFGYILSILPPMGLQRFQKSKELPHNTAAHLAVPFLPVISCRFFDLPPVNLQNLQERLTKNSLAS